MKDFKRVICGVALGVLSLGGVGATALSQINKVEEAKADVNVVGEFVFYGLKSRNVFGNMNEMLYLYVAGTDYQTPSVDGVDWNITIDDSVFENVGFWDHIRLGDETVAPVKATDGQSILNREVNWLCFSLMPANNGSYDKITITKGALIPSFSYISGGAESYYSLKYDCVFTIDHSAHVHDGNYAVWEIETAVPESEIVGDFSIKDIKTARAYSSEPTNANEALMVWVDGTDYPDIDGDGSDAQKVSAMKFPSIANNILLDGKILDMHPFEFYLNFWTHHPLFSCLPQGIFNCNSMTLKEGLLIPSYSYIKGGDPSYYRLVTTYNATRVGHEAATPTQNAWTFTADPYYIGELNARVDGEGNVIGSTVAQDPNWDGNRVHTIFAIDNTVGWKWDNLANPYNIDASAMVDDEYTENIIFDGKTLKQLNAEGKIYRMLKANSIGLSQFGVVFNSEDYSPVSIELKAGTKIPAPDGFGYYRTKMHLLYYNPTFGFFDASRSGGLDDFVKNYMHLEDVPTSDEGTGKCTSEGWYADAKTAFNALQGYEKAALTLFDSYNDAEARLSAWAAANGDVLNGWNIVPASSAHFAFKTQNGNQILMIAVICASFTLMATGLFFVLKRKKEIK